MVELLGVVGHHDPRGRVPGVGVVVALHGLAQDLVLLDEVRQRGGHGGVEDRALRHVEAGLRPLRHVERHGLDAAQLHAVPQRGPRALLGLDHPRERPERQDLGDLLAGRERPHRPHHEPEPVLLADRAPQERGPPAVDERAELLRGLRLAVDGELQLPAQARVLNDLQALLEERLRREELQQEVVALGHVGRALAAKRRPHHRSDRSPSLMYRPERRKHSRTL